MIKWGEKAVRKLREKVKIKGLSEKLECAMERESKARI